MAAITWGWGRGVEPLDPSGGGSRSRRGFALSLNFRRSQVHWPAAKNRCGQDRRDTLLAHPHPRAHRMGLASLGSPSVAILPSTTLWCHQTTVLRCPLGWRDAGGPLWRRPRSPSVPVRRQQVRCNPQYLVVALQGGCPPGQRRTRPGCKPGLLVAAPGQVNAWPARGGPHCAPACPTGPGQGRQAWGRRGLPSTGPGATPPGAQQPAQQGVPLGPAPLRWWRILLP